jgi:predicted DNA-binding protein (UPF0251 family)
MEALARPTKLRRIEYVPAVSHFVPAGEGGTAADENVLKIEELEALRLKDLEGLEQEECAGRMGVSRPTFQRILLSAREKVADSLVNGKAVRIEGGNYTRNICRTRCLDCANEWETSFEKMDAARGAFVCPKCHSRNTACEDGKGRFCRRNCRRHGRNREKE